MTINLDLIFPSLINQDVYADLWSNKSNYNNSPIYEFKYYCNHCASLEPIEEFDVVKCSKCFFHYHANCSKNIQGFIKSEDYVCCEKDDLLSINLKIFNVEDKVDYFEGLAFEDNGVESVMSDCFLKKKRNINEI